MTEQLLHRAVPHARLARPLEDQRFGRMEGGKISVPRRISGKFRPGDGCSKLGPAIGDTSLGLFEVLPGFWLHKSRPSRRNSCMNELRSAHAPAGKRDCIDVRIGIRHDFVLQCSESFHFGSPIGQISKEDCDVVIAIGACIAARVRAEQHDTLDARAIELIQRLAELHEDRVNRGRCCHGCSACGLVSASKSLTGEDIAVVHDGNVPVRRLYVNGAPAVWFLQNEPNFNSR